MKKIIMLLVIPVFMGLRAQAQVELKGTPSDLTQVLTGIPKLVTIIGEGETKLPADRAVITLKISSEHRSMQEALRLNQELRNKVLDYLKTNGLGSDRVQAAKFSTTPRSSWYSDKTKSYRIENSVKVKVVDEKELATVSGAVDKWSDVQYLGLDFEHTRKEELKKEVLAKACDNASERRKVYEEKFGVKLVPKAFAESVISQGRAVLQEVYGFNPGKFYPASGTGGTQPSLSGSVAALASVDPEASRGGISAFGEVIYSIHVAVEYSVETK